MPIIHDIQNLSINDLIQSIADQTREYDGTIISLEREFPFAFEHRDYDIRSQFWMLDRAIKEKQQDQIDDIAYAIRYTKPDDTTLRDKHNKIMNTLTNAYGFHLVRCPNCSTIMEHHQHQPNIMCPICTITYPVSVCPDLFF